MENGSASPAILALSPSNAPIKNLNACLCLNSIDAAVRPRVSKAVSEHRSVMSVPIALETLVWIVLFF